MEKEGSGRGTRTMIRSLEKEEGSGEGKVSGERDYDYHKVVGEGRTGERGRDLDFRLR